MRKIERRNWWPGNPFFLCRLLKISSVNLPVVPSFKRFFSLMFVMVQVNLGGLQGARDRG